MSKTVEEYLSLPYTIVLRRDIEDQIMTARVEELPGCSAHGKDEQEAVSNLRDNMQVWIDDCLESGDPIPEPAEDVELPSGKWLQRVPRSLHLKLIHLAKREGVSLNQLVTSALAEAVGSKRQPTDVSQNIESGVQSSHKYPFFVGDYDVKNEIGLACTPLVGQHGPGELQVVRELHGVAHQERSSHGGEKKASRTYQC